MMLRLSWAIASAFPQWLKPSAILRFSSARLKSRPDTSRLSIDFLRSPLEFATPLARPALHYDLGLGEELYRMLRLGVEVAEEAFAPAAEGEGRHGSGNSDIDAHVARV